MSCAGLTDDDYEFMKNRSRLGFRWFCCKCVSDADGTMGRNHTANIVEDKLTNIVAAVEGFTRRIGELEANQENRRIRS